MADLIHALAFPVMLAVYLAGLLIGRWCERGRIVAFMWAQRKGRPTAAIILDVEGGAHRKGGGR